MSVVYELGKSIIQRWAPSFLLNGLKKRHYVNKVGHTRIEDEPDLGILHYLVAPGDRVVDVGANIGVYTFFLSQLVGNVGRVYSFEPVPMTFEFLTNSLRKLNLRNVVARRAAITDHARQIEMAIPKDEHGVDNFYQASIFDGKTSSDRMFASAEGITLDEALGEDAAPISFIKCDVEGHELHCLHGAGRVISKSRPSWLMEVGGDPEAAGSNAEQVFSFMRAHDYEAWVYKDGKITPWTPRLRSVNYLFLTAAHVRGLREACVVARGG